MLTSLSAFEKKLRTRFGESLFSTIEVQHVFGHESSWAYSMMKALYEMERIDLVQAGTMSRFNIWRVK